MAILRRVKTKIKKVAAKKKAARLKTRKPVLRKMKARRILPVKAKKEIMSCEEVRIGEAKFYVGQPAAPVMHKPMPQELPAGYGRDRLVLQVRDPWWLHAYWELQDNTLSKYKDQLKDDFYRAARVLRVYDVSHIIFSGKNAHHFFDIRINDYADSWYIDTGGPGRSWCVELGLLLPGGRFIAILRSNTVETPLDGPSWITDEEWMIPEDMFARLYGMGYGFGQSSMAPRKLLQQRLRREISSGMRSSGGIASMASPVKKPKARKFWLVVNTELIVYGATEPDAKVTVQGMPIKLKPDGSFTLRFALPDGKQVIPVKAVSSDKKEERTITPLVTKETK